MIRQCGGGRNVGEPACRLIYRVHDEPAVEKLTPAGVLATRYFVAEKRRHAANDQRILSRVKGRDTENLSTKWWRSQAQPYAAEITAISA
jgi:hypothetical protein